VREAQGIKCQLQALWQSFLVFMLILISLQAQAADLLEVYRLAQSNDPAFEVARYTLKAAREKYPQVLAGLLLGFPGTS
jgi:hypothetical protein